MMKTKLQLVLSFAILLSCFYSYAQNSYWRQVAEDKSNIPSLDREVDLKKARFYALDKENFLNKLSVKSLSNGESVIVHFPDATGSMRPFLVKETPVFAPELTAKYPNIRSYTGKSTDNKGDRIRFSLSHRGLQVMMVNTGVNHNTFMQKTSQQGNKYVVYSRDALDKEASGFVCYTEAALAKEEAGLAQRLVDDRLLRVFRIAVSTTGEYTEYHGGNVADALAAINATLTRVNEVMEVDLGVNLELVANNDLVIFEDPDTDPYTDNLSTQVQSTLTSTIGAANYDVGHLFHRGNDSGFAGFIEAVCKDNQKGSAFSQALNPQSDTYDIDLVAHELGHQFGANHTWSFDNEGTGVQAEPASGTTIMSYAGIVQNNNVQSNSDDYFHYNSILQITDYLATISCAQEIAITNNPPVITPESDYSIPRSTAFVLEGDATDPDAGDMLTYTWEQIDNGVVIAGTFGPDNANGANFRSLPPNSSPSRYFPRLSEVAQGNLTETNPILDSAWETVSDIEREMNFALTVRDNASGGGQVASDVIRIDVIDTGGAFEVTSQASQENVVAGSTLMVNWNVVNTNIAPINAPFVDIFLSIDGGLSFPFVLVEDTPNDGSAEVLIPGVNTSQARLMVKASNNVFFALNSSDFTVVESSIVLQFDKLDYEVCQPDDLLIPFTYNTFSGFNEEATFSALNTPANLGTSFNPTTAIADETAVQITFSNTAAVNPGTYPITIRATTASLTKDVIINIAVLNPSFSNVVLTSPTDGSTDVSLGEALSWQNQATATSYELEIATDIAFNNIVETATLYLDSYIPTSLEPSTTYYWRVKPVNICGEGSFSTPFSYTTIAVNCQSFNAADLPLAISDSGTPTITSTILVVDDLPIADVNLAIDITHTWLADMVITLQSPEGTVVTLTSNSCGDLQDIDATFDDEGIDLVCGTMPGISGTVKPLGKLASFKGESAAGEWILIVDDQFDADGGSLNTFSLELCVEGSFKPDTDGDGVFDEDDLCPGTPAGAEVDVDGCEVFRFAPNNFTVSIESESCIGSNDGIITISAATNMDYSVSVTGNGVNASDSFTDTYTLNNISGGAYAVCINATDGTDSYEEHCFNVQLDEPDPLSVSSLLTADGSQVILNLSGSELYNIELNGELIQTTESEITVDLKGGTNTLKVSTLQNCQGTYEEEIVLETQPVVYPNPFVEFAFVNLGNLVEGTLISIHAADGRLIMSKKQSTAELEMALDFTGLPSGLYFVRIENSQLKKTYKVIKR
ncbi:MAG: reprolysin-like metallopeptidase [Flavobacteriaceae bacterium]